VPHPAVKHFHLVEPSPFRVIVQKGERYYPLTMRSPDGQGRVGVRTDDASFLLEMMLREAGATTVPDNGGRYIALPLERSEEQRYVPPDRARYESVASAIESRRHKGLSVSAQDLVTYLGRPHQNLSSGITPLQPQIFDLTSGDVEGVDPLSDNRGCKYTLRLPVPHKENNMQVVRQPPSDEPIPEVWPMQTLKDGERFLKHLSRTLIGTTGMWRELVPLLSPPFRPGETIEIDAELAVTHYLAGFDVGQAVHRGPNVAVYQPRSKGMHL
jgi:hypothetical protein